MTCDWKRHDVSCRGTCGMYENEHTINVDGEYVCRDCGTVASDCECWHECGREEYEQSVRESMWAERRIYDYDRHAEGIWWSR